MVWRRSTAFRRSSRTTMPFLPCLPLSLLLLLLLAPPPLSAIRSVDSDQGQEQGESRCLLGRAPRCGLPQTLPGGRILFGDEGMGQGHGGIGDVAGGGVGRGSVGGVGWGRGRALQGRRTLGNFFTDLSLGAAQMLDPYGQNPGWSQKAGNNNNNNQDNQNNNNNNDPDDAQNNGQNGALPPLEGATAPAPAADAPDAEGAAAPLAAPEPAPRATPNAAAVKKGNTMTQRVVADKRQRPALTPGTAKRERGAANPSATSAVPTAKASRGNVNAAKKLAPPPSINAPTKEPATGISFFPTLLPPGVDTELTLIGTGVREKALGFFKVNVYAVALYLDVNAMAAWRGRSGADITADPKLLAGMIKAPADKALMLTLAMDVTAEEFKGGLREELQPRLQAQGADPSLLNRLVALFGAGTQPAGSSVSLGWKQPDYLEVSSSMTGRVDAIKSLALLEALFGIYLGNAPVAPSLPQSISANVAAAK